MPTPEKIPVRLMEDLHTATIGRCAYGTQFMLNEFTDGSTEVVILYHFDSDGNYLRHKLAQTNQTNAEAAKSKLMDNIKDHELCDISVRPFEISVDGKVYGLVVSPNGESVNLQPHSQISFMEPWDGEYYT